MQKVKLLRPLDGKAEGETVEYPEIDAERLAARGVVEIVKGKAAEPMANKAEPAPENKASAPRRAKKGG